MPPLKAEDASEHVERVSAIAWSNGAYKATEALKAENARLKAEVERLSQPAIIGGYNLSQYIRMANSETLEFDNGDIFADMTLPERIKYIVESHARLRSEVERLTKQNALATPRHLIASQDIKTLREQIEELKLENSQYEEHHKYGQNVITSLREEVERLTKAGDAMIDEWWLQLSCPERMKKSWMQEQAIVDWNAAKEGKGQP